MKSNATPATWARCCVALVLATLVAGCGGLRSDAPADQIYMLNAEAAAAGASAVPGVLVLARPTVQPGLDTDRIALVRGGNELDYYAASRWGGNLAQVLGAFGRQSLAGAFTTVVGSGQGVGQVDFELLLTVRHFEAVYGGGGAPEVRVALDCMLVATAPRRVLGNCDADVREPAGDNRMGPIVQAFERAARRAFAEVRGKAVVAAAAR